MDRRRRDFEIAVVLALGFVILIYGAFFGRALHGLRKNALIPPTPPALPRLEVAAASFDHRHAGRVHATLWDVRAESAAGAKIYRLTAAVVNRLADRGIASVLYGGSALGARRNHGKFEWDKDIDLAVFSTDLNTITGVVNDLNLRWRFNLDGIPKGEAKGFGYHIDITNHTTYLDLWLFELNVTRGIARCVGTKPGGCDRWFRKYTHARSPDYSASWFFPPRISPFGPFLFPVPAEEYLDFEYHGWASICGGMKMCSSLYGSHPFVFKSKNARGESLETLMIGERVVHRFLARGGSFIPCDLRKGDRQSVDCEAVNG